MKRDVTSAGDILPKQCGSQGFVLPAETPIADPAHRRALRVDGKIFFFPPFHLVQAPPTSSLLLSALTVSHLQNAAITPPLGWSSCNSFSKKVNSEIVMQQAKSIRFSPSSSQLFPAAMRTVPCSNRSPSYRSPAEWPFFHLNSPRKTFGPTQTFLRVKRIV